MPVYKYLQRIYNKYQCWKKKYNVYLKRNNIFESLNGGRSVFNIEYDLRFEMYPFWQCEVKYFFS